MSRGTTFASLGSTAVAVLALAGCDATASVRDQSEEVAKNWSFLIRASQVMPVYPLTEDLQPGDVFLVEVPSQDEVATWDEQGYLPLSNHLARLRDLTGFYKDFYQSGYWQGTYAAVPHPRPTPAAAAAAAAEGPPSTRRFAAAEAPLAAFPTYSFDVSRSGGLSLALPVQGIPIALGLAGAERAQASVTLSDAIAYGLATNELFEALNGWSRRPEVRAMLWLLHDQAAARPDERQRMLFLRVINRVYFVGGVNVALNTTEAFGGDVRGGSAAAGGAGGAANPAARLAMPDLSERDAVANYRDNLKVLSDAVSSTLPGGDIRFGYLADNFVSLNETFPRPLAIGFIGFDVPILEGGLLGVPIATRTRMDDPSAVQPLPTTMGTLSQDEWNHTLRMNELHRLAASADAADQARSVAAAKSAAASLASRPRMAAFNEWMAANPSASPSDLVDHFIVAADSIVSEGGGDARAYREVAASLDTTLSK